jgi:hypothetical protein
VYQSNLNVDLHRVDPGSLPRPGAELPSEVSVGLTYTDGAVSGRDESKFALMLYDGQNWAISPKHFTDQANNHVSSSTTRSGVYALVQQ